MSREANKSLKKLVCAGIVILALAGCQKEARATLAETYFPLHVGNSWTYANYDEPIEPPPPGGPPIVRFTFTITGTEEIDGHTYYKFNDYFNIYPPPPNGEHRVTIGRETLFRYDSEADRVLMIWAGEDVIRYDFRGGVWTGGVYGLSRLKQSNVTCDVPAGEFSDCINFQFDWWSGGGPDAYAHGEYLAPNVGNIKFVRPGGDYLNQLEGQDVTFMLKSYTIVPEPSMLLLLGLGGLLLRKRN